MTRDQLTDPKLILALDECKKSFDDSPNAKLAWCCHHEIFIEELTEDYLNRINHILNFKEPAEQVTRFNNFRPVSGDLAGIVEATYNRLLSLKQDHIADLKLAWARYNQIMEDLSLSDMEAYDTAAETHATTISNLAKAYEFKRNEILQSLIPYYKIQVPKGTWNGKSIFTTDSEPVVLVDDSTRDDDDLPTLRFHSCRFIPLPLLMMGIGLAIIMVLALLHLLHIL